MHRERILTITAALFIAGSLVWGQTMPFNLGSYGLRVSVAPGRAGEMVPLVIAPVGKEEAAFGFYLPAGEAPVLEVLEEGNTKPVLSMTVTEFLAKAKIEKSGKNITAIYTIGKGASARQVEVSGVVSADEGLPTGRKCVLSYGAKLPAGKYVARLRLLTNGAVQPVGTTAIATARLVKGKSASPVIVLASSGAVRWSVTPVKGTENSLCVVETTPVESKGGWYSLFSFDVSGTTIDDPQKAMSQVQHIANRVAAKEDAPDLIITNTADRVTTVPGDTVTYTIAYHNIGSGYAQDAVISNPVPEGVTLIEPSAAGKNASVSFERKAGTGDVPGEVTLVKWKINGRIMPGDSGVVTMKVIVR